MSAQITSRHDRALGSVLIVLAAMVSFVPDFQIAGQPVEAHHIAMPWFAAGILLLAMDWAAHPMPKLIRYGAAILFVGGLLSPFIVNLINSSLGA